MHPYGFSCCPLSVVEGPTCFTLFCTLNVREQCPRLCHVKDQTVLPTLKQHSAISTHSLLNCRNKICWCGRTPAPLFICHTHVTINKFPTPFSRMLHGHPIRAINCLNFTNFNWSCPFCPQKPNNWSNLFLCPHTQYSSDCGTASSTKIAELELR